MTSQFNIKNFDFYSSQEDYKNLLIKIYQENYIYNIPEIIISINSIQDKLLKNSFHFALMMEKTFEIKEIRFSRGIKQSSFVVLLNSIMPSVLIEVGFINHPEESYYLRSEYGKNKIVNSIYETFCKYKKEYYQRCGI